MSQTADHLQHFINEPYQAHNRRRQEHLASLRLDLANRSVLELGAGIGDHTGFFLSRGCRVTSTDGRPECVATIADRFPEVIAALVNLDEPAPESSAPHDIVYAYGVLYHLKDPALGIATMAKLCGETLLLETCVSYGNDLAINSVEEDSTNAAQAVTGVGCRPTRPWVFNELKRHFPYVYVTRSQPWHEEFPTDWTTPIATSTGHVRAIFVASRRPIENDLLSPELLDRQVKL